MAVWERGGLFLLSAVSFLLIFSCNGANPSKSPPITDSAKGGAGGMSSDGVDGSGVEASVDGFSPSSGGNSGGNPGSGGIEASTQRGGSPGSGFDASEAARAPVVAIDASSTPGVRWFGRVDTSDPAGPRFAWSGTGFVARFTGSSFTVMLGNTAPLVFKAVVDGAAQPAFTAATGAGTYPLATGLAAGLHTVALYRQTEGVFGDTRFLGLAVGGGTLVDPPPAPSRLIEAIGASVTCGYGNLGTDPCSFSIDTESHWDTYAAIAARALGADLNVVAISGRGVMRNSDGSTEGTMPKLFDRILPDMAAPAWNFRATPQVVIINLGRNDFGVGDPGLAFRDAYADFARTLRETYPGAFIVCTTGPNLGATNHAQQVNYVNSAIEMRRAAGDANIELVDWSEQVAGQIGCDFHPNAAKHQLMAEQVVQAIHAKLGW
jgi:lysophospholipase L1-like esterase